MENDNANFFSAAAFVHSQLPNLADNGLMGYYSMNPLSSAAGSSQMTFAFLIYVLDQQESTLVTALNPIMEKLLATSGVNSSLVPRPTVDFTAFRGAYLTAATVGDNYLAGNRLWDETAVRNQYDVAKALKAFERGYLEGTFQTGPGVQAVGSNQSSINPAWRQTVIELSKLIRFIVNFDDLMGKYACLIL